MHRITLARDAMATRFEFVLIGEDPTKLRAAGEEALEEITRIEAQLSFYKASSEIAQINARASAESVRVSPTTFSLIEKAREMWAVSGGTFDITIAPLVHCWGFTRGSGALPTEEEISQARSQVGMDHLELDARGLSVRFARPGMMLDLGSIGKGYALDQAVEILRDAGVENALLHGGTSTIYGMGQDLGARWRVALDRPELPQKNKEVASDPQGEPVAIIELENQAMSVSAVWGKFFTIEGRVFGHVIDPRTGWPAKDVLLGCVVVDAGTESDALSTIVLLATETELNRFEENFPEARYLQARLKKERISYATNEIMINPVYKNGGPSAT